MLVNPDRSMRECADAFGYSQSWLSSLVHSDMFQAALAQRQGDVASRVADSIPMKLRVAGDLAVEKLTEALMDSEDKNFILNAADKILHRLGYAPQSARAPAGFAVGAGSQVNFQVNVTDLARARELMVGAPVEMLQGECNG
jgi:hypothetical protein